jgi:hypothetical protein
MNENRLNGNKLNGNKLLYVLLSLAFTIILAMGGVVYNSLNIQINRVSDEQGRRTGRIATLETRVEFTENGFKDIRSQLLRIESEIILLRIALSQGRR